MPGTGAPGRIYSATYSHVPVFELMVDGDQVMRRRADDYVNATHILKAADFDKPARTRILEREVQKGIHEKVQGGYGKYQGTWIPMNDARLLAEKNGVLDKLRSIFDFTPGAHSPPPAPKHATAASNKPKAPRQNAARRVPGQSKPQPHGKKQATNGLVNPVSSGHRMSEISYDNYSARETPDHASLRSQTPNEYLDAGLRYSTQSQRKRKRGMDEPMPLSPEEQTHLMWTDELLDYFMLQGDPDPLPGPPEPPSSVNLDRAIDEKGHTPMHWAAAMGDMNVVQDLLQRGAQIDTQAVNGETPLMRAVLFTNNYDKQCMDQLIHILVQTIPVRDLCGSTVFHHITATTNSKTKYAIARYYLQTILARMESSYAPGYIAQLLDQQDQHGDTAVLIAARYGARKCIRLLMEYGASTQISNSAGETAHNLIDALNARRRERHGDYGNILSSSPVRDIPSGHHLSESINGLRTSNGVVPPTPSKKARTLYRSEAANLLSSQLGVLVSTRAEHLAAEIEKEVADREAEVADNTRVLEARREEVDRLRLECEHLLAEETHDPSANIKGESTASSHDDHHHTSDEVRRLEAEVQRLLESAQGAAFAALMREAERTAPATNGQGSDSGSDRTVLAHAVLEQQTRRRALVEQIVASAGLASDSAGCLAILSGAEGTPTSMSRTVRREEAWGAGAGASSKRTQYTRLIRSALGMPVGEDAEIEELLPEILKELEDAKREREDGGAGEGTQFAAGGGSGADVSMLDVDGVDYGAQNMMQSPGKAGQRFEYQAVGVVG